MKAILVFTLLTASAWAQPSELERRPDDFTVLEIVGTCMDPVIRNGQLVLVDEGWPFARLVVGDVIKFKYRGQKYAHRIVEIRKAANGARYFVTKGDNVRHREIVTASDYLGKIQLS